jgi:serine/threonine protein kinase
MPDKVIAGYEIEGTLGEGGMGGVYRARDATLGRPVALKLIRSQSLSAEGRERFLREARACSAINHPNIVTVYAAGEDNGRPYLAMEFLEGQTLREIIEEGPVPWEKALRWAVDLLDALGRLHQEGIVHRDLKPENILITSEGRVKLMDFGIAHMGSAKTLTQAGTSLGTAHYMSPEQAAGRQVDARSDLFSIASVIYEMLTGALPFGGEESLAVLYSITNAPPKPLAEHAIEYPEELPAIIDKALEKSPDDRYTDAASFKAALEQLIGPREVPGPPVKRLVIILGAVGVIVIAAVIIGSVVRNQIAKRNRETARQYNEMAADFERRNDLGQARIQYRKATIADPTFARPWNNLGMLEQEEGNVVEADSLFRKAIEIDSTYTHAIYNLATVRWDLGDHAGAEAYYGTSIETDSTFAGGYNNLAALLHELGRTDEAAVVLWTGLSLNPDNPFLLRKLGQVQVALNQDDEARTSWMTALEEAMRRAQDKRLADEIGTTADELKGLLPVLHTHLARWYEDHGNKTKAITHWQEVANSGSDADRAAAAEALNRLGSQ